MMRSFTSLLVFLVAACASFAQVAIDGRMILTGPSADQRQVLGLPPSVLSGDVLTGAVDQSGALAFGVATTTTPQTWQVTMEGLSQGLVAGTHVLVEVPETEAGSVTLNINGTGDHPVILRGGTPLSGDLYEAGSLLSLVYDGSSFQVMNGPVHRRRECPTGMVQVNESTCIDLDEHPSTLTFFDAVMVCIEQNKRMCSWGEWHTACRKNDELGLSNMSDNGEWTANTANYDGAVRIVGDGNCYTGGTESVFSGPRRFRCCIQR